MEVLTSGGFADRPPVIERDLVTAAAHVLDHFAAVVTRLGVAGP